MNLKTLQKQIQAQGLSGWLFCDFHNRDHIAYKVLGLDFKKPCSRRWFYFVPATGAPRKLVHAIEPAYLQSLPGSTQNYSSWQQLHTGLKALLAGAANVAMQYSPRNNIPTISLVDGGTLELVRASGVKIVSSAELVQRIYSVLTPAGFRSHQSAGKKVQAIKDAAFARVFKALREKKSLTELEVQAFILGRFKEENLYCGAMGPIVGANEHAADPHFEPTAQNARVLKPNDRLLIDLWAKENTPDGIYYDITWCGFLGTRPPPLYVKLFDLAMQARDTALTFIDASLNAGKTIRGWQVDKVCRGVIQAAGFGDYFVHRTGHSIDSHVHGEGANIDSLETQDDRQLLPSTCFSIEPGIYYKGTGVRTEVSVCIDAKNRMQIEGAVQGGLVLME